MVNKYFQIWDEKKRDLISGRKAIFFLYFKAIKKYCSQNL